GSGGVKSKASWRPRDLGRVVGPGAVPGEAGADVVVADCDGGVAGPCVRRTRWTPSRGNISWPSRVDRVRAYGSALPTAAAAPRPPLPTLLAVAALPCGVGRRIAVAAAFSPLLSRPKVL